MLTLCLVVPLTVGPALVAGADPVRAGGATLDIGLSTSSSPVEPLRPGDEVDYQFTYGCSGLGAGQTCEGAQIQAVLPTVADLDGNQVPLELVSAGTSTRWSLDGGALLWAANSNLGDGDSGSFQVRLRLPTGVIPADDVPQEFTFDATLSFPGDFPDVVASSPVSYANALPPVADNAGSVITKTGPAEAILAPEGADVVPVTYRITICPGEDRVFWHRYEVTDVLPPGAEIVGDLPLGGVVGGDGTITWDLRRPDRWPSQNAQGCLTWTYQVSFSAAGQSDDDGLDRENVVTVRGFPAVGDEPGLNVTVGTSLTLRDPEAGFNLTKQARHPTEDRTTFYVNDEETIVYRLGLTNDSEPGAAPFSTVTLTDELPPEFTLSEIRTGSWATESAVTVSVQVSTEASPTAGSWVEVSTSAGESIVPTGDVRWVRWVFSSSVPDAPAFGPGWNASGMELVGNVGSLPDGLDGDDPHVLLTNCASLLAEAAAQDPLTRTACRDVRLEPSQPHPDVRKSASSDELLVGGSITYTITAANDDDATGVLEGLIVTDCVPDSAHLTVDDVTVGTGWTYQDPPPPGSCADGETPLVFTLVGTLAPGTSAPDITYVVTASSYGPESQPAPAGERVNRVTFQPDAVGTFNHCVQTGCETSATVEVPFAIELESRKLVRGTLDDAFNRAGTTTPGGQVTWRISVVNRSNVDVEDVVLIDTFPHVGDTGVQLVDQQRGTEYSPRLVELIDDDDWHVEYSRSSNPCRAEFLMMSSDPTGCEDPQWTDDPDELDLASYRSIKLTYVGGPEGDPGRLNFGERADLEWTMVTPVDDPSYTDGGDQPDRLEVCTVPISDPPYDPDQHGQPGNNPGATTLLDRQAQVGDDPTCPVATNSFAYGVLVPGDQLGGLAPPGRLGAEPAQVDLHVAAQSTGHAIGDRVWFDDNLDGIQDDGEQGVPNIRVELYDADTQELLATTFTGEEGSDAGLYRFDDLGPGDYFVRFYLPDDAFVSPRWQDDTSIDGDRGSAGNSNLDSDVPQQPSGSNVLGNYYDTPIVTLGNPQDVVDGQEIDLTWDAGIWVPDPSITLDKQTEGRSYDPVEGVQDVGPGDGITVTAGLGVTWVFDIVNDGNTPLGTVTLTDDAGTRDDASDDIEVVVGAGSLAVTGIAADQVTLDGDARGDGILRPGESWTIRIQGLATEGLHENVASVVGTPVDQVSGEPLVTLAGPVGDVTDDDPSSYTGEPGPAISLEKYTNREDADIAPGPVIRAGETVTWTFEVTNTGSTPLIDVVVLDEQLRGSRGEDPDEPVCTWERLEPDDTVECELTGERFGSFQQENLATVAGTPVLDGGPDAPAPVTDDDPSHHFGFEPGPGGSPPGSGPGGGDGTTGDDPDGDDDPSAGDGTEGDDADGDGADGDGADGGDGLPGVDGPGAGGGLPGADGPGGPGGPGGAGVGGEGGTTGAGDGAGVGGAGERLPRTGTPILLLLVMAMSSVLAGSALLRRTRSR